MLMKRFVLCILSLALMLLSLNAMAESCSHENLLMCSLRSECQDLVEGHQYVQTKSCVCDDCSTNIVQRIYGQFVGHTFHMSESIHFDADGMHLWVFICPECYHVALRELECAGGEQCGLYKASIGEIPPVQQGESWEAQKLLTDDDYIRRWIAQKRGK